MSFLGNGARIQHPPVFDEFLGGVVLDLNMVLTVTNRLLQRKIDAVDGVANVADGIQKPGSDGRAEQVLPPLLLIPRLLLFKSPNVSKCRTLPKFLRGGVSFFFLP